MDAKKDVTLERIELVKDKTGVTYKEAKAALDATDENVVNAIIKIEEEVNSQKSIGKSWKEELSNMLKEIISKGNVTRVKVRKGRQILLNLPITAGIIGVAMAPTASVVGLIAALGFKCSVEIQKEDGSIISISKKAEAYYDYALDKAPAVHDYLVSKGLQALESIRGTDVYKNISDKKVETLGRIEAELDEIKSRGEEVYEVIKEKDAEITKSNAKTRKQASRQGARAAKDMKAKKAEFIDSLKK